MSREQARVTDWRRERRWRWWNWRIVSNRRWRARFIATRSWLCWDTSWHLWKFKTWMFVCQGLTVYITSWEIDGETVETVRLYFGGLQNTAEGDWSYEIKRCLLLGRKVMTNLDSIFKSRHITLPTKVQMSSQGYDFSSGHVWMWELDCEQS